VPATSRAFKGKREAIRRSPRRRRHRSGWRSAQGEYESTFGDGSIPGEWKAGDPVRLAGDKLYPCCLNGRELQITIVKSIGY
jgi:hypothetical protein